MKNDIVMKKGKIVAALLSQKFKVKETDKYYNKYVSSPIKSDTETEKELLRLFGEAKERGEVILDYKLDAIYRIAEFIKGDRAGSASIGIAGETASGKSTVTLDIINTIENFAEKFGIKDAVTRINTDDYYYDRSEEVKRAGGMAEFAKHYDFDVPEAIELDLMYKHIRELSEGRACMLPEYDMSGTAVRRDNHTEAFPSKIIISEGLFTLTERIRDAFDFKIYVHTDNKIQRERFFIRADERGLGVSAGAIYDNASSKADIYIRPCKRIADIVVSGGADREEYRIFIKRILGIIEQSRCLKQAVR